MFAPTSTSSSRSRLLLQCQSSQHQAERGQVQLLQPLEWLQQAAAVAPTALSLVLASFSMAMATLIPGWRWKGCASMHATAANDPKLPVQTDLQRLQKAH